MAKQIKVLKCPQCGSTQPLSIAKDHFRCSKCDSDFILDNDEININVKHTFSGHPPVRKINYKAIGIGIFLVVIFLMVYPFGSTSSIKQVIAPSTNSYYHENIKPQSIDLFNTSKGLVVFYMESRDMAQRQNDGVFGIFYDPKTKQVLSEIQLSSDNSAKIKTRHFPSQEKFYCIIDGQKIAVVDPQTLTIKDYTNSISLAKPALESGFSKVDFVDSNKGDGLILTTNLDRTFYYFPSQDQLYTKKAFEHLSESGNKGVSKTDINNTTYLFVNSENMASSNIAQLFRVEYKYANGAPENKITSLKEPTLTARQKDMHRIVDLQPITEQFICFSPKVVYQDNQEVIITYKPTLAQNAASILELVSKDGKSLWKVDYPSGTSFNSAVKVDSTYYLLIGNDKISQINTQGEKLDFDLF
ncbi:hypothetical protein ACYSNM_09485 [Myroides sp. LJL116]